MGQSTAPGMWCDLCKAPVAGVKTTHRFRNVVVAATAIPTMGYSALGAKSGVWHCPTCGQPVRKATKADLATVGIQKKDLGDVIGGAISRLEAHQAAKEASNRLYPVLRSQPGWQAEVRDYGLSSELTWSSLSDMALSKGFKVRQEGRDSSQSPEVRLIEFGTGPSFRNPSGQIVRVSVTILADNACRVAVAAKVKPDSSARSETERKKAIDAVHQYLDRATALSQRALEGGSPPEPPTVAKEQSQSEATAGEATNGQVSKAEGHSETPGLRSDERLADLKRLREDGILSDEEFENAKRRLEGS